MTGFVLEKYLAGTLTSNYTASASALLTDGVMTLGGAAVTPTAITLTPGG